MALLRKKSGALLTNRPGNLWNLPRDTNLYQLKSKKKTMAVTERNLRIHLRVCVDTQTHTHNIVSNRNLKILGGVRLEKTHTCVCQHQHTKQTNYRNFWPKISVEGASIPNSAEWCLDPKLS